MTGIAARRWAELQAGRGIPPEVLAGAPVDPWTHRPQDFTAPAVATDTPSRRAAAALLDGGGTLLDVGCGGGDATFAVAELLHHATGVDQQADMLDLYRTAAQARGVTHRTVEGRWPEVAPDVGTVDVVVSHHVLHNVVDLPPFLTALTVAAGRGVVVEMLEQHPMAWLDPLWVRFHDLRRPPPATTDHALAVLREEGLQPQVRRWERESPPRQDPMWVTRRLCLPSSRAAEVEAALEELPPRPRWAATLVWRL